MSPRWWQRPAARGILVAAGALVAINLLAFVALVAFQSGQGDTVLDGVHVDAEPVGGLSRDDLTLVVDDAAERRLGHEVLVVAGDGELPTTRGELGTTANTQRTIDRAWDQGRRGLWRALWDHLRARRGATTDLSVQLDLDRSALGSWADEAASELSQPPRDAAVELAIGDDEDDVTVEATEPREGRQVEPDELADDLAAVVDEPGQVRVEVDAAVEEPTIGAADLDAVRVDAERAVSAPVLLTNPSTGADLGLSRADLARYLAWEPDPDAAEGERLRRRFDDPRLGSFLDEGGQEAIEADPVEGDFAVDGDQIEIVGGTPGFELDRAALAERIVELALQEPSTSDEPRTGELPGTTSDPETSRADLEELGIEEQVSSFTTELTPGEPRNTNIHLGADLLDGAMIEPGGRFSLNDAIGPRTRERGFVENGFIDRDGELTQAVGGGSSQLGTTFLNAAWFAGIEIVDFKPHSLYFSRYPMGREATLSFGTIDVVVVNDSPHHILVATEHTETSVTIRFFSTAWAEVDTWTGEPFDRVEGEVRDGFTIEFGRTITYPDGTTDSEDFVHRYEPEDETGDDAGDD